MPTSIQLFPKLSKDQDDGLVSDNWMNVLKTHIVDESNDESYKERRRELLQVLSLASSDSEIVVKARSKKNHLNSH